MIFTLRPGAQDKISMELPQKVWPIDNVRLPLVIKFLDCLLDTGGGVTPEPHFKGAPKLKHFNGIAAKLEPN